MNNQTISLETFCNPKRPELARPFSIDAWTYASDGVVLVRVPRRNDVGECEGDFAAKFLAVVNAATSRKPHYSPAPNFKPLEIEKKRPCYQCGGKGTAHPCPACQCECTPCHGTGEITSLGESVKIGCSSFAPKYLSLLQSLPNLELDRVPRRPKPMRFRFDGGEGLLSPCRA